MRDPAGVRAYAAMLMAEQADHDMRPNQVAAEHFGGYVDVLDGRQEAGLARIRRAIDESRQGDQAPGIYAHSLHVLVEACAAIGDARAGLTATDRALDPDAGARIWEADTRRRRAEFSAALGAPATAVETEFERALDVGRRQGPSCLNSERPRVPPLPVGARRRSGGTPGTRAIGSDRRRSSRGARQPRPS